MDASGCSTFVNESPNLSVVIESLSDGPSIMSINALSPMLAGDVVAVSCDVDAGVVELTAPVVEAEL